MVWATVIFGHLAQIIRTTLLDALLSARTLVSGLSRNQETRGKDGGPRSTVVAFLLLTQQPRV